MIIPAYAGGWKKLEPFWDWIIRTRRAGRMLPMLEQVLAGFGRYRDSRSTEAPARPDVAA
jgi:hypothetical protein